MSKLVSTVGGPLGYVMGCGRWRWLGAAVGLVLTASAWGDTYSSSAHKDVKARLAAALSQNAGSPVEILDVKPSEAPGLLLVTVAGGTLYATEDGRFFLAGDLYQVEKTGFTNLTERQRNVERQAQLAQQALENMIIFSPEGETRDYITVFTDVDCGYCQKLHREVGALNDMGVEVRYLAFPRGGMQSPGADKLMTAWCAKNPQETLSKLKNGLSLPTNRCDAPISEQYDLGVALGVRGTPAIFTSDGTMIPGYRPAKDIVQLLGIQ